MSGDADLTLCAPKAKILRIRAEYTKFSTQYGHLVMAFECGPVDSTDARAEFFSDRARGCRAPAMAPAAYAWPASLHVPRYFYSL
jgi:hypothetical protein